MNAEKLTITIDEAERFLAKAFVLKDHMIGVELFEKEGSIPKAFVASARRASLDLSRALVEMRKG